MSDNQIQRAMADAAEQFSAAAVLDLVGKGFTSLGQRVLIVSVEDADSVPKLYNSLEQADVTDTVIAEVVANLLKICGMPPFIAHAAAAAAPRALRMYLTRTGTKKPQGRNT